MHAILYDEVNFQSFSSLDYSKYIPVHTRMYRYVQVQTSTNQHTSFDHAPSALRRLRVSAERLAWSSLTVFFLIEVSSILYDGFLGDRLPVGEGHRWHLKSSWGRAYQQSPKGTSAISSVCCRDREGPQQWYPAHTPAPQHRNKKM